MLKTLKNLALALINATLILIVLGLFLTWKVVDKADQISSDFAANLVTVEPLRADIQAVTAELAALRADVAQVSGQSGDLRSASLQRIETRLDQMQGRMDNARQSLAGLSQAPARLVDQAIDTAADRLAQGIADFRGCTPSQS